MSMAKEVSTEELIRRVERLEDEVSKLRKSRRMTAKEEAEFEEDLAEIQSGKTISHAELEKELGL